ncbi:AraC family transcriptional regulator [Nocardia sp. CA2R105]|uniref:helix-turn-helix transcriptional regulator n=1 Tax=Nocardia coffeae TaxID=2873381 RepID=UPI001CA6E93C|nr:AraC family transcriptional regulator [Nocardia coffeae]MBY8858187.1 AraC family transcriptional regulator [Nocardia coffeae]
MDQNGHVRITEVPFRPPPGGPPGVEVWDFARLRERAERNGVPLGRPLRAEFHHLIAVKSHFLNCWADDAEFVVSPGTWLWICAGQVYRFDDGLDQATGTVLLFMPGFLDTATLAAAHLTPPYPTGPILPDAEESAALDAMLDLLDDAYRRTDALPPDARIDLMRHLLAALAFRLGHVRHRRQGLPEGSGSDTFQRFHDAVERDFADGLLIEDYAATLGYSVRTLTRACLAATGRTAKRYLDDRTALEAKRLLVHTDLSPGQVASRLGFTSPTVFGKFFRRCTGETPASFRARARSDEHPVAPRSRPVARSPRHRTGDA